MSDNVIRHFSEWKWLTMNGGMRYRDCESIQNQVRSQSPQIQLFRIFWSKFFLISKISLKQELPDLFLTIIDVFQGIFLSLDTVIPQTI